MKFLGWSVVVVLVALVVSYFAGWVSFTSEALAGGRRFSMEVHEAQAEEDVRDVGRDLRERLGDDRDERGAEPRGVEPADERPPGDLREEDVRGGAAGALIETTGSVVAVDASARRVTVRAADGGERTFAFGTAEVRVDGGLGIGDRVTVRARPAEPVAEAESIVTAP